MENEYSNNVVFVDNEFSEEKIVGHFGDINKTLVDFKTQISILQNQMKELEKYVKKSARSNKKNDKKQGKERKPSGFAKPSLISEDLSKFMNLDHGTKIPRTEVTKYINKYIKDNNLQYSEDRRIIKPDQKLEDLLKVGENNDLNYFNLQKYMNKHFIKEK